MTATPLRLTGTPELPVGADGTARAAETPDPFAVVPQVLDLVRLSGAIFFRSDFRAPWAYSSPAAPDLAGAMPEASGSLVVFHIVVDGHCWVRMDGGERHELSRGDIVVMPYGDANTWGSDEPADPVSIVSIFPPMPWRELPHLVYGGDGAETRVVCGYLSGDAVLFDPVLRALPSIFVVRPTGAAAAWVTASVEYAMSDPALPPAGTPRPDQRLAEAVFTEVLRIYLEERRDAVLTGWLAALRDPVVGAALARLHEDPAHDWTVAELAHSVAASRTVLVDGFVRFLGKPPIRYLTYWRLSLASGLLRTTDESVVEVAGSVGYASEEAFSRAFKRAFGQAPAHWRAARAER